MGTDKCKLFYDETKVVTKDIIWGLGKYRLMYYNSLFLLIICTLNYNYYITIPVDVILHLNLIIFKLPYVSITIRIITLLKILMI